MKLEYKILLKKDLNEAFEFQDDYVGGLDKEEFNQLYKKHPKLFVACYDNDKLIGIVFGEKIRGKDFVILKAIAVKDKYWGKGIGSKLMKNFENQVKKANFNKISVGSAEDEKTENFYLKNGYKPSSIFLKAKNNYKQIAKEKNYKIKTKTIKGKTNLYIKMLKYSPKIREKIKKDFKVEETNYIFEKKT